MDISSLENLFPRVGLQYFGSKGRLIAILIMKNSLIKNKKKITNINPKLNFKIKNKQS